MGGDAPDSGDPEQGFPDHPQATRGGEADRGNDAGRWSGSALAGAVEEVLMAVVAGRVMMKMLAAMMAGDLAQIPVPAQSLYLNLWRHD